MNKIMKNIISILSIIMLTGCPGDRLDTRYKPNETASVSLSDQGICLQVSDPRNYQPEIITISSRDTPIKERWYKYKPNLAVDNGTLCIPSSFYQFPTKGQFIVNYILTSQTKNTPPRHVVVGFEISNGHAYGIQLQSNEF